ncbi:MAG: hypothetical protein Q9213_008224 [Squamulea squamosa]
MNLVHYPSGIPPPKKYAGHVLAIQGLPPSCKSKHGWRMVKDLLRAILASYDRLEPVYGKPGMVHIKSSSARRVDMWEEGMQFAGGRSEVIWAHCNMKNMEDAWLTYRKYSSYGRMG